MSLSLRVVRGEDAEVTVIDGFRTAPALRAFLQELPDTPDVPRRLSVLLDLRRLRRTDATTRAALLSTVVAWDRGHRWLGYVLADDHDPVQLGHGFRTSASGLAAAREAASAEVVDRDFEGCMREYGALLEALGAAERQKLSRRRRLPGRAEADSAPAARNVLVPASP